MIKITVEDLMIEYMICKIKHGFEPQFSITEFTDFLSFFENIISVDGIEEDKEQMIRKIIVKKYSIDWSRVRNVQTKKEIMYPHMTLAYDDKSNELIIRANYQLGNFDQEQLNDRYNVNDKNSSMWEIKKTILEWLSQFSVRTIDNDVEITENDSKIGKTLAAQIIINIWESYVNKHVMEHKWPLQCTDINKYLFETDLAQIIGLTSIKKELLEVYNVFSKRIAILYHQDMNLKISSKKDFYLARANYELLIRGYEKFMSEYLDEKNKIIDIDLSDFRYIRADKENQELIWGENLKFNILAPEIKPDAIEKVLTFAQK